MNDIIILSLLLLLLLNSIVTSKEIYISVNESTNNILYSLTKPIDNNYIVYGNIINNINSSSWNYLDLIMNDNNDRISNREQYILYYKGLGFAEGYITCTEISQYYENFASDVFGKGVNPGDNTIKFIQDNYNYLLKMINENKDDDYWFEINQLVSQIEGMYNGFIEASCIGDTELGVVNDYTTLNKPTITHFLLLSSFGDLYQIALKLTEPGMNSRSRGIKHRRLIERCSALIKVTDNDIIVGHNTWDSYETLSPRIFKHLSVPLFDSDITYNTYFSSSPGLLSSVDDFYTVKGLSSLQVIETTNSLFNVKLLHKVVPSTVLSYMRVMVANKLATNGETWSNLFSKYHSGTYTNQWLIVDNNKFNSNGNLDKGLLTVLEEVPGLIIYNDQTDHLISKKYWPSYNYPFYPEIQEEAGYKKLCDMDVSNCYENVPRAQLFKANQDSVNDIESFKKLMQLNDWQSNPLSLNSSCDAIACRGDLDGSGAFGALDAKVSSILLSKSSTPVHYVKLGPTIDTQEVFCWSKFAQLYPNEYKDYTHKGSPDCFNYLWQKLPTNV